MCELGMLLAHRMGKPDLWCLRHRGIYFSLISCLGSEGLASAAWWCWAGISAICFLWSQDGCPASGTVSTFEAGRRKGGCLVLAVSVPSIENMSPPKSPSRFLFMSLWPELCPVAAPSYKGARESEYLVFQSWEWRWQWGRVGNIC